MSDSYIALLIFASTTLLVLFAGLFVYESWLRYHLAVRARLKQVSGATSELSAISLFKDLNRTDGADAWMRRSWVERLNTILEQAGMQLAPKLFLAQSIAIAIFLGAIGGICAGWIGMLLVPVGLLVPLAWILARRSLRQRKLCKQLPEAFSMISRAVRSGQTVPAALQTIAEDFEAPIASEFALCYEQQNLGMSRETALKKLACRTGIMELQIFVVAMLVQSRSGGDLVTLLDNLAEMVRKRLKLRNRIRALTGEGRLQAIVLIILPILAFVGMVSLEPDYSRELLDRKWLLGVTAFAQVLGALWIRRIVNFDY